MSKKKFILSDESLNSTNRFVRTSGINLERFLKNPVMFYNHDREAGVIGRWEDVEVVGTELVGVPVFNEETELGRSIKRQVDSGFIRAASIGIEAEETREQENGAIEIVRCVLYEVSICDIPANSNTVIQLYEKRDILKLAAFLDQTNGSVSLPRADWDLLLSLLHLAPGADFGAVLQAVKDLNGDPVEKVKEAFKNGYLTRFEKDDLLKFYAGDPARMLGGLESRLNVKRKEVENEVERLFQSKFDTMSYVFKLSYNNNSILRFKEFVLKNHAVMLPLLRAMPEKSPWSINAYLGKADQDRAGWTLDDYRKKDPRALKNDPELYERLLNEQKEHSSINN